LYEDYTAKVFKVPVRSDDLAFQSFLLNEILIISFLRKFHKLQISVVGTIGII